MFILVHVNQVIIHIFLDRVFLAQADLELVTLLPEPSEYQIKGISHHEWLTNQFLGKMVPLHPNQGHHLTL